MTDPSDIVFSPVDVAELTEGYLAERRNACETGGLAAGLPLYIEGLDAFGNDDDGFLPLLDGDLMTVIARPGHGKTSFMMRWARKRTAEIRKRAAIGDPDAMRRIVVYCTWEQTVEALHSFHVAASNTELGLTITKMARGKIDDSQWRGIQEANIRRMSDPLWFIGHSIKRKKKRPTIDVDSLAMALWNIENWQGEDNKFQLDSVFLDFLQRIPYDKADGKIIGISDNLDRLKNAALSLTTKLIVGCQAKADVDKRDDPTPLMEDGQWTSNIEQTSDVVATLIRPCKYRAQGALFNDIPVQGFKQMCVTIAKQKMGDSNFNKWVDFDPRYNELENATYKHYDVSNYRDTSGERD